MARPRGILLDFPPKMRHEDAQVVSVFDLIRPPHFFQQLPVRQHSARVAYERGQQTVLRRR
jgi:hypothetical protein